MQACPGQLQILRPQAASGTELLIARGDTSRWRYYHERYALCAAPVATGGWFYRRVTRYFDDEFCTLYEPGETHTSFCKKPADFTVFFFDPAVVRTSAMEMGLRGEPHFACAQDDRAANCRAFTRLAKALVGAATTLEQQVLEQAALALLLQRYAENSGSLPRGGAAHGPGRGHWLERARDYLHEHFSADVSLQELAALTHTSRFHLVRAFTGRFGVPPHCYQLLLRVERSRALLRAGVAASAVASMVGFADQSHYTRHFRKLTGVTPAVYAHSVC